MRGGVIDFTDNITGQAAFRFCLPRKVWSRIVVASRAAGDRRVFMVAY